MNMSGQDVHRRPVITINTNISYEDAREAYADYLKQNTVDVISLEQEWKDYDPYCNDESFDELQETAS